VSDPAAGFFIAGSSIDGMNGVYGRIHEVPIMHAHRFHWAYHNQLTGWVMGLAVGADDGASYETFGGKGSEWLIVDGRLHDRFGPCPLHDEYDRSHCTPTPNLNPRVGSATSGKPSYPAPARSGSTYTGA
jgi:hypothetical protein